MNKKLLVAAMLLFGILGSLVAIGYHSSSSEPPTLATSFLYPKQRSLAPFELTDQYGNRFDNARLQGKWSLIFIGYTSCPDVCPTTMAKLASAYKMLDHKVDLQVVFISVDPDRDNQQKLLDYINFFNPEFVAATGPHQQVLPLTRQLGMVYSMVGEGENYQVDHSASMVLISPAGHRYATIKPKAGQIGDIPQISITNLVGDIDKLNHYYQAQG
ncbi:SCO family protein [Shewanella sp. Isolate11]|uniref:SCO family protein n=1 Tax=Shewanella sp. Isolate11 TaxID=2908530 RepID=UPI001EFD9132|nr:SCO family protein [Shewanella sp. Isolate11]MCG9698048.1 SCO family protein [Shewanella sp. Isolate11]